MRTFKIATAMLGVGLAGVLCAGAAGAAPADSDVPTVVVHYSDLTLGTDSGVKQLYRRIVSASKQVCPDARSLSLQYQVQVCRDQAVTRAIEQVHNPRLVALHAAHAKNG
jgi:UrcA family protein